MSQGILTVYVPQLGASAPITLPVPVGYQTNRKSYIDRFLAGLPSAGQITAPDNFNINPSASDWILFDIGRLSYIHRNYFNLYLENLSPNYLESRSYILLSIHAAFRFTSNSLGTNFLDELNTRFPETILYPTIDDFLKQQAVPPWDRTLCRRSFNLVLWIPGFALPWDIIIAPVQRKDWHIGARDIEQYEPLNLENAILKFTSNLLEDIPQHRQIPGGLTDINELPQPIVPIPQHNWVLVDLETQQIIPQVFVNDIPLRMNECKNFILAPITLSELAYQLLTVIKDRGAPGWEACWKTYAAERE
ncbi:hypothetical protein BDZ91DRAFT_719520 [Kalaharituber pfeilii]|nr:hypothetical protein BDZ91DRAFT_719520 [Kalaharituber pfeilii]